MEDKVTNSNIEMATVTEQVVVCLISSWQLSHIGLSVQGYHMFTADELDGVIARAQ